MTTIFLLIWLILITHCLMFQAIYPGRSLFLVYSLKDFPRTSLLYLWLYFREEMFMPFLEATARKGEIEDLQFNSTVSYEELTFFQIKIDSIRLVGIQRS